jgi:hypothetical protein
VRFATVGVNELRIWSATQTDSPSSSSPRQIRPPIAIPRPGDSMRVPTEIAYNWDASAGKPMPSPVSPRSAVSYGMPSEMYSAASDTPFFSNAVGEGSLSIKVEMAD